MVRAASGESTEVWIGLWKPASSPTVEWSDGSPVTLTLWHQYHPPHNLTDATLCAKAERKVGNPALVLLLYKKFNYNIRSFSEQIQIELIPFSAAANDGRPCESKNVGLFHRKVTGF